MVKHKKYTPNFLLPTASSLSRSGLHSRTSPIELIRRKKDGKTPGKKRVRVKVVGKNKRGVSWLPGYISGTSSPASTLSHRSVMTPMTPNSINSLFHTPDSKNSRASIVPPQHWGNPAPPVQLPLLQMKPNETLDLLKQKNMYRQLFPQSPSPSDASSNNAHAETGQSFSPALFQAKPHAALNVLLKSPNSPLASPLPTPSASALPPRSPVRLLNSVSPPQPALIQPLPQLPVRTMISIPEPPTMIAASPVNLWKAQPTLQMSSNPLLSSSPFVPPERQQSQTGSVYSPTVSPVPNVLKKDTASSLGSSQGVLPSSSTSSLIPAGATLASTGPSSLLQQAGQSLGSQVPSLLSTASQSVLPLSFNVPSKLQPVATSTSSPLYSSSSLIQQQSLIPISKRSESESLRVRSPPMSEKKKRELIAQACVERSSHATSPLPLTETISQGTQLRVPRRSMQIQTNPERKSEALDNLLDTMHATEMNSAPTKHAVNTQAPFVSIPTVKPSFHVQSAADLDQSRFQNEFRRQAALAQKRADEVKVQLELETKKNALKSAEASNLEAADTIRRAAGKLGTASFLLTHNNVVSQKAAQEICDQERESLNRIVERLSQVSVDPISSSSLPISSHPPSVFSKSVSAPKPSLYIPPPQLPSASTTDLRVPPGSLLPTQQRQPNLLPSSGRGLLSSHSPSSPLMSSSRPIPATSSFQQQPAPFPSSLFAHQHAIQSTSFCPPFPPSQASYQPGPQHYSYSDSHQQQHQPPQSFSPSGEQYHSQQQYYEQQPAASQYRQRQQQEYSHHPRGFASREQQHHQQHQQYQREQQKYQEEQYRPVSVARAAHYDFGEEENEQPQPHPYPYPSQQQRQRPQRDDYSEQGASARQPLRDRNQVTQSMMNTLKSSAQAHPKSNEDLSWGEILREHDRSERLEQDLQHLKENISVPARRGDAGISGAHPKKIGEQPPPSPCWLDRHRECFREHHEEVKERQQKPQLSSFGEYCARIVFGAIRSPNWLQAVAAPRTVYFQVEADKDFNPLQSPIVLMELWMQALDGTRGYLGQVAVPYDGEYCQFPAIAETIKCLEKPADVNLSSKSDEPRHRLAEKNRALRTAKNYLQIKAEEEYLILKRVDQLLRSSSSRRHV